MRLVTGLLLAALAAAAPDAALAQGRKPPDKKATEEDWVKEKPTIGDRLPDLTVYDPDGKEVKTADLRGKHVVLTFGCLT